LKGEVIGINTAIFSQSGGSIGIGFAIPANMVRTVVESAETGRRIQRPWIGAELQDVTPEIAESLGFARPEGALLLKLHPESPLAAAGITTGDVILAFEGKPIENAKEFSYRVATAQIGSSGIIEYERDGKRFETRVGLIGAPETTPRDETLLKGQSPFAGLMVANLSPAVADELGLPATATGVAATDVKGGPARRLFRKGDVILEVNGVAIDSVETLSSAIERNDGSWQFAVNRGGQVLRLQLGG
jgi:S1-C subfamily serine protease